MLAPGGQTAERGGFCEQRDEAQMLGTSVLLFRQNSLTSICFDTGTCWCGVALEAWKLLGTGAVRADLSMGTGDSGQRGRGG